MAQTSWLAWLNEVAKKGIPIAAKEFEVRPYLQKVISMAIRQEEEKLQMLLQKSPEKVELIKPIKDEIWTSINNIRQIISYMRANKMGQFSLQEQNTPKKPQGFASKLYDLYKEKIGLLTKKS